MHKKIKMQIILRVNIATALSNKNSSFIMNVYPIKQNAQIANKAIANLKSCICVILY